MYVRLEILTAVSLNIMSWGSSSLLCSKI